MSIYEELKSKKDMLAVVGLGYVGMPIAVAFSKHCSVIGYDINREKVSCYQNGMDPTKEIGNNEIASCSVYFTSEENDLKKAGFVIIAVPTPVKNDHTPDLKPVIGASQIVGRNLKYGAVVVYESTVYPGVTEEICIPILERESGLVCGRDFRVGYSPERINPGDKEHRLESIVKIVSGMDDETKCEIAKVYEMVIKAGIYPAESIKVAEAAKVIENSQRDINIAFMNELSIIFHKMGIDTKAVLKAANTKWNFMKFYPGLVGGHCIGVDPYYLTYKAEQLGYHSQIILSGRRINDEMGKWVAQNLVKLLVQADCPVKKAKVAILGFTFKENCPDSRNTKVIDIVNELEEYGISPLICDPIADLKEAEENFGVSFVSQIELNGLDAVIIAVAHKKFEGLRLKQCFNENKARRKKIIIDLKGMFEKEDFDESKYLYWRL